MCLIKGVSMRDQDDCPAQNNSVGINCSGDSDLFQVELEMDVRNNYHTFYLTAADVLIENFSNLSFPNSIWIRNSTLEISMKTVSFLPIIVGGILGNIAVLHVIRQNRLMRTPINLFIANMAVADLLTAMSCPWIFMCMDSFQNFVLGSFFCLTEGFLQCSLMLTSVFSLIAVSYDRLMAIISPLHKRLTNRKTYVVLALTWVFGAVLALPLMIFREYKERQWSNFLEKYCKENTAVLSYYWQVLIGVMVWFPLAVMLVCYSAILIKLDHYEQTVLHREHRASVSYKTRVLRMLFAVVIVFLICWMPFTTLIFIRTWMLANDEMNQVTEAFRSLWFASHYLMYSNAALNPIIYSLTNENFRRAFRTSFPWMFRRKRPSTSDTAARKETYNARNAKTLVPRGPCHTETRWPQLKVPSQTKISPMPISQEPKAGF